MTTNWKTMRNTLVWLLVAVITMGIVISSPYATRSSAASLPTVTSCKGLTVKKSGKNWVTVNAKGNRINYTGIASNKNGWWRTENGVVNFKATGIYQNDYGWYRVEKGTVNFNANEIYQNDYGWWKTTKGKVTFKENGIFKNQFGWWKVVKSKVDFSFEGIASNQYGKWYLEKGKVRFDKNGSVKYNGVNYYIVNGKAIETANMNKLIQIVEDISSEFYFSKDAVKELMLHKQAITDFAKEYQVDKAYFINEFVTYACDNADVNWNQQAVLASADYLEDDAGKPNGFSRAFLVELLKEDLFTEGNINYALSFVDKDYPEDSDFWKQSALISAQIIVEEAKEEGADGITRDEIKTALKEGLLFTEDQAAYGAQNVIL